MPILTSCRFFVFVISKIKPILGYLFKKMIAKKINVGRGMFIFIFGKKRTDTQRYNTQKHNNTHAHIKLNRSPVSKKQKWAR
jgi:hypothetical protein